MPNSFTYQILKDTTEKSVIKLTGLFDGSGQESNTSRIQANTLYGALDANGVPLHSSLSLSNTALSFYNLSITRVNYSVNMPSGNAYVQLYWTGSQNATIAAFNRNGELDSENLGLPSILNNAGTPTGDIGVSTTGAVAGSSYTIVLELRKDNAMYQRGQFNDPAAFNYGPNYSLRP